MLGTIESTWSALKHFMDTRRAEAEGVQDAPMAASEDGDAQGPPQPSVASPVPNTGGQTPSHASPASSVVSTPRISAHGTPARGRVVPRDTKGKTRPLGSDPSTPRIRITTKQSAPSTPWTAKAKNQENKDADISPPSQGAAPAAAASLTAAPTVPMVALVPPPEEIVAASLFTDGPDDKTSVPSTTSSENCL